MVVQKENGAEDFLTGLPPEQQLKLKFSWQVGKLVQERREALGWTTKELQDRSGVKHTDIWQLENCQKAVGINVVVRLFSALGLELQVSAIPTDIGAGGDRV